MRVLRLSWQLLRYRVAIMLLLFLLLSVAIHEDLSNHLSNLLIACACLALSYISATSLNDIADQNIDKINHPNSPGRPLINGRASIRDIRLIFILASVISLLLAALINFSAVIIITISILINIAYSLPPLRFSYRTYLAPINLGLAYVGVPYVLGLVAINHLTFKFNDWEWLTGLYLMFIGRIILKDFRDRKGDKKYKKPTFLLHFGKNITCMTSIIAVLLGGLLIIWQIKRTAWLLAISIIYLGAILAMILRLRSSLEGKPEQASIGLGAKMGNGFLITLLSVFTLAKAGAPESEQILISTFLLLLYFVSFISLLRKPEEIILGYKG